MSLKQILIDRDGVTEEEADQMIAEAKSDLAERLEADNGSAEEICEDHFDFYNMPKEIPTWPHYKQIPDWMLSV